MPDVTPQSVYDSLNAVRQQMANQQLAEQRQYAAAEYARRMALGQQAQAVQPAVEPVVQQVAPARPEQQQDQPEYLGDAWLAKQAQIAKAKQYTAERLASANLPPEIAKQYKEAADLRYDPTGEYSQPFRKSALYENAKTIAHEKDTNAQRQVIDLINKQVSTVDAIGKPEDTPEQIRVAKTNAIKTLLTSLINSAKGAADAEQFSEFARRSPELMTYPEFAAVYNKSLLDPKAWMAFAQSKEGKNFVDKVGNSISSDPDAYLNKVRGIHNDLANTWNQRMQDQVIRPTNPQTAKELGIVLRPLLPIKEAEVTVVRPTQQAAAPTLTRQQAAAAILQKRAAERAKSQAISGLQGD